MSNNWLNKIRQHEATPPGDAWKNIASYLDREAAGHNGFAAKLAAMEIAPPAAAQKNIFALLDETEKITAFEERVYHYEEEAPVQAWPNIAAELDKTPARVISIQSRSNSKTIYRRAAAAAVIIALVSVTAWLLNKQNAGAGENSAGNLPKQSATASTQVSTTTNQPAATPQVQTTTNAAVNPKTNAQVQTPGIASVPAYVQNNQDLTLAQNPVTGKKDKLQTVTGETPEDMGLLDPPNSYISVTGPDGQSIRISSKFSALISYLTEVNPEAQENIDIIIKESAQWRATFAKWREKMTNNTVAPSISNFMDIIELSNVLEEKK